MGAALLVAALMLPGPRAIATPASFAVPSSAIPRTYLGMHLHRVGGATVWPAGPFGSWRLWDAYVNWRHLQPRPHTWDFSRLDSYVGLAQQHRIAIVLPLGVPPEWAAARPTEPSAYGPGGASEPADMADWRRYVRRVAERYRGRIQAYEIWNEPNDRTFYTGTAAQLAALARAAREELKAVDLDNLVISPAAVGQSTGPDWLAAFLAAGGGDACDVIAYHLYVPHTAPEAMLPLVARLRGILAASGQARKPLWNTETGWEIASAQTTVAPHLGPVLTPDAAAAYVARAHILAWAAGVERFFWYSWDHYTMGLIEPDGRTAKPVARAYAQVADWLVGARMHSCGVNAEGVWVCRLTRPSGAQALIAWRSSGAGTFMLPADWKPVVRHNLSGARAPVVGRQIPIGPAPSLIEVERSGREVGE